MTIRKTRIKCSTDGLFHAVEFHKHGSVISSGCNNITQDVERMTAMLRLGKAPSDPGTCTCLAALVLHGCEIILRRPADEEGVIRDLSGWQAIYTRFEENKLVLQEMKRIRARLRRERKKAAAAAEAS